MRTPPGIRTRAAFRRLPRRHANSRVAPTSHHTRPDSDGGADPVMSASTHPRDDPGNRLANTSGYLAISARFLAVARTIQTRPIELSLPHRAIGESPRAPPAFGRWIVRRLRRPRWCSSTRRGSAAGGRPKPGRHRPNATARPAVWAARMSPCTRPHARAGERVPGWQDAQRPLVPPTGRARRRTRSGADRGQGQSAALRQCPGCRSRVRSDSRPCGLGRPARPIRSGSNRDARASI